MAVETLTKSNDFLYSIYQGADLAIFVVDVTSGGDFRFSGLNPAHEKSSGLVSEEIRGKAPEDLVPRIPAEAAQAIRRNYTACLEKGTTYEYEETIPIDGRETHWLTRLTPLRNGKGRIYRIVGTALDISVQKRELTRAREEYLEQLNENEKVIRSMLDHMQGIAYRFDTDNNPVNLFGSIRETTGYSSQEFMSGLADWNQLILAEDRARMEQTHPAHKFLEPGYSATREYRIKNRSGDIRWLSDYSTVVSDQKDRKCYIQGVITDITLWKEAEILVRESEERLKLIALSTNLGIWDWKVDSNEVFYNNTWKAQLGYEEQELSNKFSTWEDLLHPDDKDRMLQEIRAYLAKPEGMFLAEFRLRHKDGSFRWISNRASSLLNEKGEVVRMFGAHTDISQRKTNELKIRESEMRFRSLFENARDLIHIVNPEGVITHVNKAELNALGYTSEEMVGKNFLQFIHPESRQESTSALSRIGQGQTIEGYETVLQAKSGKKIYVQASVVPEMSDGALVSACAILHNVTELKRASRELARANEGLIENNRELEQIVYVTSHDLRSPLVNIQGFNHELEMSIQELRETIGSLDAEKKLKQELDLLLNQEIPESIEYIKSGIRKMDLLLKGLLTISRLGRRPMETETIGMNKLLQEVTHSLQYQLNEAGAELKIGELSNCRGDRNQLNQVFSNLIENAIKYRDPTRKLKIVIKGNVHRKQIVYQVEDNGIGIPPGKHEKIFEIFYKNEPGKPGEGLGLTVVRKIVEKHYGRIRVESFPGQGSKFIITLSHQIILSHGR